MVIFQQGQFYDQVGIKISADSNFPKTLTQVQAAWQQAFPKHFYDYEFFDNQLKTYYESESQLLGLFKLFTGLAILISCLGLWGLATHSAMQRHKEIGIRKVLGASVSGIVSMMSLDFLKPVAISVLLSIPLAWFFYQSVAAKLRLSDRSQLVGIRFNWDVGGDHCLFDGKFSIHKSSLGKSG